MTPAVRVLRWLAGLVALIVAFSGLLAVGGALLLFVTVGDLPRIPEPLKRIIDTPPTRIFASNGEQILQIGGREYISLDQVSTHFIQAILAIEDHLFWEHHGINKLRTLKALWVTLFSDGQIQGASTITQQLVKNLFFSFEQTYTRKFRELLVALQIESQFSKKEILEAYINQIYFRPNAQGISQAARVYFGKTAAQLTLPEAALLAGLAKSATRYNPLRYPDRAKSRQKLVLDRMAATGFISRDEAAAAAKATLEFRKRNDSGRTGSYFVDWVLKTLEERYGPEVVYHGGLKVTTTMDPHLQLLAEESLRNGLDDLDRLIGVSQEKPVEERVQGALVAVQVNSGALKAMVGGRSYLETEFNRAVENNRLPGSGFKPFLYYTAIESLGLSPSSVVIDQPIHIPVAGAPDWKPRNFERQFQGPVILKKAFSESINTVAAQLVARTGPEAVIDTSRRCGITSPLQPVFSVALGTSGISPLEMASGLATFASGGVRYDPFGIWRVEDAFGQVLEEHIISGTKALDTQISFQVVDMMQGVLDHGTGKIIRKLGFNKPAAGKTGTTNDYKDAWFTGFTPGLSASVWVGYDRASGMKDAYRVGITGGRGAAPIWAQFMIKATEGEPPRPFIQPDGIRMQTVDPVTGRPMDKYSEGAMGVVLRESTGYSFIRESNVTP